MKMFQFIIVAVLLCAIHVRAQITLEISLDQDQFLPSEPILVTVRITNRSGQTLHLGTQPDWLTFSVEASDNYIVIKKADVPVPGPFDLGSMETATKTVNIEPYFVLGRAGLYRVSATLRIANWNSEINSTAKHFDISTGAKIWSQAFGIPGAGTNRPPEVRRYVVEKANYLRSQLRLYVLVTDETETRVLKVSAIGPVVSFSQPEMQLDRTSNLHLLYQSGGQSFLYSIVNPNGDILQQEIYDYGNSRPRLGLDDNGKIVVIGGAKRVTPTNVPDVKSPNELVAPKGK